MLGTHGHCSFQSKKNPPAPKVLTTWYGLITIRHIIYSDFKMRNMNLVTRLFTLTALGIFVSGCAPRIDYRGKLPEELEVKKIIPGKTSQMEVATLIGSPTLESSYGSQEWLYIYKKEETKSFLKPDVTEDSLLRINFNPAGIVTKVTKEDPNFAEIDPVKYKTESVGQDTPMLQQIFSNFGRLARKKEPK